MRLSETHWTLLHLADAVSAHTDDEELALHLRKSIDSVWKLVVHYQDEL